MGNIAFAKEQVTVMSRPAHTIMLQPWRSASFGQRLALEMGTAILSPLPPDDRMTVLINLLAAQLDAITANDDEIDAVVDVLRMQLKLRAA
jgi:hypothetical protein